MERLTRSQFEALVAGARTLTADEYGPKVLQTPDGRIIKLFRRKRLLSSTLWNPYALRFERAGRELALRSIPAVHSERAARVPHLQRDIVIYRRLDGVPLRDAIAAANAETHERLLDLVANVLAMLHARGVYFRAAHFGNFLVQDAGGDALRLALIDVSEAQFRRGPLPLSLRARNFRPLTSYAEDRAAIAAFGVDRFVNAYFEAASLPPRAIARLRAALRRVHPLFDSAAG